MVLRLLYERFIVSSLQLCSNSDVKRPDLRPGVGRRNHFSLCLSNFNQLLVTLVPGKMSSVLCLQLAYCARLKEFQPFHNFVL